ncbi:MAG: phosphatidylglycerophosphatase A family protein [bacterium]
MKRLYNKFILFIATGSFVGYIPFAPGTFGSMLGIIIYYYVSHYLNFYLSLVVLGFLLVIGIFTADRAEVLLHEQDSSKIVIDEITGMYIALFLIPLTPINIAISFLCFRLIDIFKPYPISYIDKHVHRGPGVMLDDIVGAIPANLIARILIFGVEVFSGKTV